MENKISEIKAVLRSILISSTVVINVVELNKDFKELMGIDIPYKDLGYDSLLGFLKSIPDVLVVKSNSNYSEVYLVESEKSAHVSNLVLRQRSSKKPGAFHSSSNKRGRRNSTNSPRFKTTSFHTPTTSKKESQNENSNETAITKQKNEESSHISICDKNKIRERTKEPKINQLVEINKIPETSAISLDLENSEQRLISENKTNFENSFSEIKNDKSLNEGTTLLRRIDYKIESPPQMDLNLKDSLIFENSYINSDVSSNTGVKQKNTNYRREGTTSSSRLARNINERSYVKETIRNSVKYNESASNMASDITRKHYYDSHSRPIKNSNQKNKPEKWKSQNIRFSTDKGFNAKLQQRQNSIPKTVEDNLYQLISSFPEGLWCSELPTVYKKLIGQELDFEKYGYRCLNHLCFDLENIFHCIRESSCDYKIYDARKPRPEIDISLQHSVQSQSSQDSSASDSPHAVPEMSWSGYDFPKDAVKLGYKMKRIQVADISLQHSVQSQSSQDTCTTVLPPAVPEISWSGYDFPKDAVKLGYRMKRIQVTDIFRAGTSVKVVVAEIYDISKFWIYLDDTKLDSLMSSMQDFYKKNNQYLLPKSLIAEGLICVVLFQSKFHRAVVINPLPGEDYIKVYYFDFGTLGRVSKSEVWFITQQFSELPTQAIRARLADIYPPYQGVTWSPFANYDFSNLTCMKKFTAEICRIDEQKNLVDIKLKNVHGTSISDTLVDKKHALFINTTQKKRVDDPNCESKVQFIHLFPTFEEIENWIVPSMEEAANFLNTPVTADFLFAQYFTRKIDMNLIDSIEEKMKIISKKKKALTKFVKTEELVLLHDTEEMNKIAYGQFYKPSLKKTEVRNEIEEKSPEVQSEVDSKNNSWVYMEDDETLARILRQSRMKKVCSVEKEKDVSGSSLKVEGQKPHSRASKELTTFSELEKYLSEESSSRDPSKKSSPDLIDLDNAYPISLDSSTNLLLCSDFEQSTLDLAKSRKKCGKCLLTESTSSDMENCVTINPLDFPIPISLNNNLISPDLIQFDEDEPTLENTISYTSMQGINSIDTKSIFNIQSEEMSDADDEDSDSKQNCTNDFFRSKEYKKKIRDREPTEKYTAFEVSHFDAPNTGVSTDLAIQEIPDILNIPELAYSTNINVHHISGDKKSSNQSCNLDSSESIISKLNGENDLEKSVVKNSVELHNMKTLEESVVNTHIDKIQSEFNKSEDTSNQKLTNLNSSSKKLTNGLDKQPYIIPNRRKAQEKSVDSKNYSQIDGNDLVDLRDRGNMNVQDSSSSTNLYYSCESKESSVGGSCSEDSLELPKYDADDDIMNTSTPLPKQNVSNKDESFLEEFDIIANSPTLSINSDERSKVVSSSFSTLSEEFVKLDVSQLDTDEGSLQVSKSAITKEVVKKHSSDMDLESTLSSSIEVIDKSDICSMNDIETSSLPSSLTLTVGNNLPDSPVSLGSPPVQQPEPQPSYVPNYIHQPPPMSMRGPPPGFPAIPFPRNCPPGFPMHPSPPYSRMLPPPNSLQYPHRFIPPNIPIHQIVAQQQDIFGAAMYYGAQPIVILNYNIIPPQNQNESS